MSRSRDHDDEDRDYREPPRSSSKTLLIILGIIAAVICVCVVVCGGLAYYFIRAAQGAATTFSTLINDVQTSQVAADTFMRDVAANRLDDAYANTTKDFQARQTIAQFRDFVKKNPELKNYQPSSLVNNQFQPALVTFQGSVSGPNGQVKSFTLHLAKDGTAWKIDTFTIP